MMGIWYVNWIEIGPVVIEILGVENGDLEVPVNNTLVCHTPFLATDTRLCVLIRSYHSKNAIKLMKINIYYCSCKAIYCVTFIYSLICYSAGCSVDICRHLLHICMWILCGNKLIAITISKNQALQILYLVYSLFNSVWYSITVLNRNLPQISPVRECTKVTV